MPYKMKLGNILDSTDDAIINSLGVHTNVYGRLCKNIIDGANSVVLKNYIDNLGKVNILDTFVTKGYNLKSHNIIHIVTPFKKYDNDGTQLTNAYRAIFNKAIENGFKSISIAFIGTGANGYSDKEASNAISIAVDEIIEKEENENKEILSITLYVKPKTREELFKEVKLIHRERIIYSGFANDEKYISIKPNHSVSFDNDDFINNYRFKAKNGIKISNEEKIILAQLTTCEPNEMLEVYNEYIKNGKSISYTYDFVTNYINVHNEEWKNKKEPKDTARLNEAGIDKKKRYNLSLQKTRIDSDVLFAIAFVLGMNKAETLMLMQINGTTFNIFDDHSIFYMEYLNDVYGDIDTFSDFNNTAWNVYHISFGNLIA